MHLSELHNIHRRHLLSLRRAEGPVGYYREIQKYGVKVTVIERAKRLPPGAID